MLLSAADQRLHCSGESLIMACKCLIPGQCETWSKKVRWAEIHSCRAGKSLQPVEPRQAQSQPRYVTCRDCIFQGLPALAPSGKQIGSEGCSCTSQSIPSGVLWWSCDHPVNRLKSAPVREDRARKCSEFQPTERD